MLTGLSANWRHCIHCAPNAVAGFPSVQCGAARRRDSPCGHAAIGLGGSGHGTRLGVDAVGGTRRRGKAERDTGDGKKTFHAAKESTDQAVSGTSWTTSRCTDVCTCHATSSGVAR